MLLRLVSASAACAVLGACGGDVTASGTASGAGTGGGGVGTSVAAGTTGVAASAGGDSSGVSTSGAAGANPASVASAGGSGGCNVPADCPQPMSECLLTACDRGICGEFPAPQGTPVPGQAAGDCMLIVCDGMGNYAEVADDADILDDANDCTDDYCVSGTPVSAPKPIGAVCAQGPGKLCDGAGNCVECVSPADCPNGVCTANKCG